MRKHRYNVYTDSADYRDIWARSAADAAEIVSHLNYCRVRIVKVERADAED